MKKFAYLFIVAGLFAVSCSSDDDNGNGTGNDTEYLPLTQGNYWVYDTESSAGSGTDSLYVANDTVVGATTYKKFKTGAAPTGFYSGALSGNTVRQNDGKLIVTGTTGFSFSADVPLNISITDFTFFDANASANANLDSEEGTITQEIEGYPIEISYELKSVAGTDVAALTANGVNYTNVKTVVLTLTLEINAMIDLGFGNPVAIPILAEQPVVVSTQYYVENIGAVKVTTDINYELEDLSLLGDALPIPATGSEHQEELLVDYHIE